MSHQISLLDQTETKPEETNHQLHSFETDITDAQPDKGTNFAPIQSINEEIPKRKGLCHGLFSPIKKGSKKSAIIALMATSMGVIVLGLPYNLRKSGLWVGVFFLILGGGISFLTLENLMYFAFKRNHKKYSDCVYDALGSRTGYFFQWIIITYILCCITNFQLTGAEFVRRFLVNVGVESKEYTKNHRAVQILLCSCIIYPISCMKDLHAIRHTTLAVIFSTLYIVVAPAYFSKHLRDQTFHVVPAKFDINLFRTFAITTFSYVCHTNIFQIKSEVRNNSYKKMRTVCIYSILGTMMFYLVLAVVGYLSFQELTPKLINLRPRLNPRDTDILMTLGDLFVSITIAILATPVRLGPCRDQIFVLLDKTDKANDPLWHYGITALIVFSCAGMAIIFPDVYVYFTVIGGTLAVLISITFPCLCYIAIIENWTMKKILNVIIMAVGMFLGFAAAMVTAFQEIEGLKDWI